MNIFSLYSQSFEHALKWIIMIGQKSITIPSPIAIIGGLKVEELSSFLDRRDKNPLAILIIKGTTSVSIKDPQ